MDQSSSKLSHCINHSEIMCKIQLKWYLTPVRFNNIKPDAYRFCWRQCGAVGMQFHMLWQYPVTSSFWCDVAQLLIEVLQYKVILSPELAVPGSQSP